MEKKVILEFDYMHRNTVCSTVKLYENLEVEVVDFTDYILYKAFGNWSDKVSLNDIHDFFDSRVFPETRVNAKQLLNDVGLTSYNSRTLVEITHGIMDDDFFWIRFPEERDTLTWEKVRSNNVTHNK